MLLSAIIFNTINKIFFSKIFISINNMNSKATEKIIDGLNQLLEGYAELKLSLKKEFGYKEEVEQDEEKEDESKESETLSEEFEEALAMEIKGAMENVVDNENYSPQDFAEVFSLLSDSLEELDPDIFASAEDEDNDDDDDDDDDDSSDIDLDDDLDDDDDNFDFDDDDDDDLLLDEDEEQMDDDDDDNNDDEDDERRSVATTRSSRGKKR